MIKKIIQFIILFVCISISNIRPVSAGLPVIDFSNLIQSIFSVIESISIEGLSSSSYVKQLEQYLAQQEQYAQQLKDYNTQLEQLKLQNDQYANEISQLENLIFNTESLAKYNWDDSQGTINKLIESVNTLAYYKNKLGSLDAYLGEFGDIDYYSTSPCFTSVGCTEEEMEAIRENRALASQSQKKANSALFKGIDAQQDSLIADAAQLKILQDDAQNAQGQMQALQTGNQLASHTANQTLQMRAMFVAQANAVATRQQAEDNKAAQLAAGDRARTTNNIKMGTNNSKWKF